MLGFFTSKYGFHLPAANVITFFDSRWDPNTLDDQLTTWLKNRIGQFKLAEPAIRDLIVYYVGHGCFDEQRRYYLALRSTRAENQSVSSLRAEALLQTLNNVGGSIRKYLIIDACFAGQLAYSQSTIQSAVQQQMRNLPLRGTTFLCSSSKDTTSEFLPDGSNTVFTKALTESLWDGDQRSNAPKLTLHDVARLVQTKLWQTTSPTSRPEVHTPDQPEGNIAGSVLLFPNGPRHLAQKDFQRQLDERAADLRDYLQSQADEQSRRQDKLEAERRAREEEYNRRLAAALAQEKKRHEPIVHEYTSEQEKAFCQEADRIPDRNIDLALLKEWCEWRATQLKVRAGALTKRAQDHYAKANESRFFASNIWDHLSKAQKSGSPSEVTSLSNYWRELLATTEREDQAALKMEDEVDDAKIASEYFSNQIVNEGMLTALAERAKEATLSVRGISEKEVNALVRWQQRRRAWKRFGLNWVKWMKRVLITLFVLTVIGTCLHFAR